MRPPLREEEKAYQSLQEKAYQSLQEKAYQSLQEAYKTPLFNGKK
jgi:hypothetical protein